MLRPTRKQVNVKDLLRVVHAAEQGVEAGAERRESNLGSRLPKLASLPHPESLQLFTTFYA